MRWPSRVRLIRTNIQRVYFCGSREARDSSVDRALAVARETRDVLQPDDAHVGPGRDRREVLRARQLRLNGGEGARSLLRETSSLGDRLEVMRIRQLLLSG